jgi:tRNA U34 2-thiouridine synthase MnmA/TrmU
VPATYEGGGSVRLDEPHRRVAPGQTVALYAGEVVVGAGIAA